MILFISSYNDILLPPISERLRALEEKIALENIPSVIGMDSNGWSFLWAKAENPRGLLIEDWILENGFCVETLGLLILSFVPEQDRQWIFPYPLRELKYLIGK